MHDHVECACLGVYVVNRIAFKILDLAETLIDIDKFVLRPCLKLRQLEKKLLSLYFLHDLLLVEYCIIVSFVEN